MKSTMLLPYRKPRSKTVLTMEVEGIKALFMVGESKVAFFIHQTVLDGPILSHWASGQRVGRLNPVKVREMCHRGHHARMNDREAAQALLSGILAHHGAAIVLAKFEAAPIVNV